MNTSTAPTQRTIAAIVFSGATYFIHFLALGFASFPLQTHLRNTLGTSSASIVVSIVPIAACLTFFFFRFAESRGWTNSPQRVLFLVAIGVSLMQLLVGWRMNTLDSSGPFIGPIADMAICLLMLGCVQSSCMTLLNHIGVATMGVYAYTVRAAGSAGYMLALILMGASGSSETVVSQNHLYIGSAISMIHAAIAFGSFVYSERFVRSRAHHNSVLVAAHRNGVDLSNAASNANEPNKEHQPNSAAPSTLAVSTSGRWFGNFEWIGLLMLVWLVAICEMSYGLYAHEFLTATYGPYGYFVFAGAVAIEIGLLVSMPMFPQLKKRLLFVGPMGWMLLFTGCLIATQGYAPFGILSLALALNCPFQISANEHAHRMNPSVLGVASMALAQSLGYTTATFIAAGASHWGTGPAPLWMAAFPLAGLALVLAVRKLARQDASLDVENLGQTESMSRSGGIASIQESSHDLEGQLGTDHASSDAEDIHVVVLDALPSRVGIVTETGSNPRKLVSSHANTHS